MAIRLIEVSGEFGRTPRDVAAAAVRRQVQISVLVAGRFLEAAIPRVAPADDDETTADTDEAHWWFVHRFAHDGAPDAPGFAGWRCVVGEGQVAPEGMTAVDADDLVFASPKDVWRLTKAESWTAATPTKAQPAKEVGVTRERTLLRIIGALVVAVAERENQKAPTKTKVLAPDLVAPLSGELADLVARYRRDLKPVARGRTSQPRAALSARLATVVDKPEPLPGRFGLSAASTDEAMRAGLALIAEDH